MKKILLIMLILGLISTSNAVAVETVIDVVAADVGTEGHAGTSGDPLVEGETIPIKLVLNSGFWLSSMDITLVVSGPGSLSVGPIVTKAGTIYQLEGNSGIVLTPVFSVAENGNIPSNTIDRFQAITGPSSPIAGADDLVWNMFVTCTGGGDVPIDLTIYGLSEYSAGAAGPPWAIMSDVDLGGLTLYQPTTYSYALTTSVVDNVGGSLTPGTASHPSGTVVILTALPDPCYQVKAWTGTDDDTSTATTNSVTVTSEKSVSVEFELAEPNVPTRYSLGVTVDGGGAGGSVSPSSGTYDEGAVVPLTAIPYEGWRVKSWAGIDPNSADADPCQAVVTMDDNKEVTIRFELIPPPISYVLTASVVDEIGGTVSPTQRTYYDTYGETVIATPLTGYQVKQWTGVDEVDPNDPNRATVTMNDDRIIAVEFELVAAPITYTLTASVVGSLGGTIDPCGINTYSENDVVQLTAVPDAGYEVKAWTGIDTGSSGADPDRATVTMTADKVVTVEFEEMAPPVIEDPLSVSTMTIKADKSRDDPKDSFNASGTFGSLATEEVFLAAADQISVDLVWGTDPDQRWPLVALELDPCDFDQAGAKARYTYQRKFKKTDPTGGLSLARFDFTGSPASFSVAGSNIDLSGLKGLFDLQIMMGSYQAVASDLTDDDVNGSKPIPLILLSGKEDVIKATKAPKVNSKQTSFSLSGEIVAVDPDVNLGSQTVTITWGPGDPNTDKTWQISGFEPKGTKWTAKTPLPDDSQANVTIDFGKATFKVSIKKGQDIPNDVDNSLFTMTWPGFDPRYELDW